MCIREIGWAKLGVICKRLIDVECNAFGKEEGERREEFMESQIAWITG